jgi:hypothetical protein
MLQDWVITLCRELDIDPEDVAVSAILDLAKDAAHTIERPAAPVTTFIVGYAAGLRGGREFVGGSIRDARVAIAAQGEGRDSVAVRPVSVDAVDGEAPLAADEPGS